ncbi:MAG: transporter [Opitutae bacterium]|nr:transporter [Opitutae bacterium]
MISLRFRSRLAACLAAPLAFALPSLPAQTAAASAPALPRDTELHKIDGIFNTDLPKTERKNTIRVIVHPRFGDLTRRNYLRVPTGIRWGINNHTEVSATIEPYFAHGLKSGAPGTGIGDLQFGAKYAWHEWLKPDYDTSVGLNLFFPVGRPPVDLTNGFNRYSPYIVIGKKIRAHPGLTVFVNTGLNFLSRSSTPGFFQANEARSNSFAITPGFVWDRYPWHYTFEATYESTSLIGRDNKQFLTLRPGLAWDLPRKLTFNSNGRWLVGFGYRLTLGPDGTTSGSGGKIRGEFRLKRLFGRGAKGDPAKP